MFFNNANNINIFIMASKENGIFLGFMFFLEFFIEFFPELVVVIMNF